MRARRFSLSFGAPDTAAFTCLALAGRAGKEGGTLPCVLNAANEVAVDAYLSGACGFNDIGRIVERALDAHEREDVESLEQLSEVDAWARARSRDIIASLAQA